jgi:putative transposase
LHELPANDWFALKQIGQLFTTWPSLRQESHKIIRVRVQRYKCAIGITALCPKPRTTTPAQGHKCCPYLLRDLRIEKPNVVWYAEIIDLPTGCCFLYLVAIMDCVRRMVLSWRLPNTIDAASCMEALEEAPATLRQSRDF